MRHCGYKLGRHRSHMGLSEAQAFIKGPDVASPERGETYFSDCHVFFFKFLVFGCISTRCIKKALEKWDPSSIKGLKTVH
ncbi:hypothetical protein K1719_012806 [Acacia pycnantha]|nr:hypothetical protein K1719_012806 [Acacia pycnantha]